MSTVPLTNVSEDGGHCVGPRQVTGQTAVHAPILLLHVSYDQCAVRSHPVSEHVRYTIHGFSSQWREMTERWTKNSGSDTLL